MVDPAQLIQPPQDPKQRLAQMEAGLFDAINAMSAALGAGLLQAWLTGVLPDGSGAFVELIFPAKADQPEDAPNPSKLVQANNPVAALAIAGELVNQMIILDNQNNGHHQDYVKQQRENRELRKTLIVMPGARPGRN